MPPQLPWLTLPFYLLLWTGRCNEIVAEVISLLTRKHKSRKGRVSLEEAEEDRSLDGVREVLAQADRLGFEAFEVVRPSSFSRVCRSWY